MRSPNRTEGFTLVELLLYTALSVILMTSLVAVLFTVTSVRQKNAAALEIDLSGASVLSEIEEALRDATGITSPGPGTQSGILTVTSTDLSKNPTIIDLSGGVVRITEGSNAPLSITPPSVLASNLSFTNVSVSGTRGSVTFTITLSTPEQQRREISYERTFQGSSTLRQL